jgi:D-glycero-beta-D-manno-heptose 1-phosphate adenylyltransferase
VLSDKTVFTNGCFDIIHRGHLELLQYCRDIGNYVIVGLNSDDSVKRLKGNERPYFNEQDRKFLLESLSCVDEVHIFDEDTPYNIISKLKPDIIVKGGDYVPSEVVGNDISDVIIFNFINGYSTTKILDKMK